MAFSLKNLFLKEGAIERANATYKARIAEINEKAELDKLNIEAARLVNNENYETAKAANNAAFKEAWAK